MGGTDQAGTALGRTKGLLVRVLGRFGVELDDTPIELPAQAQRVVGYLAVTGRCERREQLAGTLWPYSPQHRADANLRTALWRIRRASPELLEISRMYVALAHEVDVDLYTVEMAARALLDETALELPVGRLWEHDLLPSWDEDWLVIERERARQLRIHGLEALSRSLSRQGRFAEAIDAAFAAIAAEPLRESAHAALIRAHLAEGNVGEAQRQFRSLQRLMQDELGIAPSDTLSCEVYAAITALRV